jgi:hypothetical protein
MVNLNRPYRIGKVIENVRTFKVMFAISRQKAFNSKKQKIAVSERGLKQAGEV